MSVSETIVRVPTSDLVTLRVKCVKCEIAVEISSETGSLMYAFKGRYACPFCGEDFRRPSPGESPIRALVRALEELRRDSASVSVEFVVKPTA